MSENLMKDNLIIDYERVNASNYLKVCVEDSYLDNYQLKMIEKNRLDHFLRIGQGKVNGKSYLTYDISSRQQFSSFYKFEKMRLEDIRVICFSIQELVRIVDEYMLDLDYILIDPEYIYMDIATKELQFLYLPSLKNSNFKDRLKSLFEYLLEKFDHSTKRGDLVLLYELYQHILTENYDPYNLLQLYSKLHSELIREEKLDFVTEKVEKENQANFPFEYKELENQEIVNNNENLMVSKVEDDEPNLREKYNGMKIPSIAPEEIMIDDPSKQDKKKGNKLGLILGVGITVFAAVKLFMPTILKGIIPTNAAFILLVAGVLIIYISIKKSKKNPELKKEKVDFVAKKRMDIEDINDPVNQAVFNNNFKEVEGISDYSFLESSKVNNKFIEEENLYSNQFREEKEDFNNNEECHEYDDEKTKDNISVDTVLLSDFIENRKNGNLKLVFMEDSAGVISNLEESIKIKDEKRVTFDLDKKTFELKDYPLLIGNFKEVPDIFLDSKLVSRMHASIYKEEDEFLIEDLNSSNGTFLNDLRLELSKKEKLKNGDIIRIATVSFKVEIS